MESDVETIVDDNGILWLNEKHIWKGLDHKNVRLITGKYLPDHRKHRYEPVDEPKKQSDRIFIDKELAIKVIIGCTKIVVQKFRTRLGFVPMMQF